MQLLWVEKALWKSPPKTSLFPPISISLGLSGHSHCQPPRHMACDINLYTPNIRMPILGIFHVSPEAMWGAYWDREAPAGGPSPRHQRRGPETEPVIGSTRSSDQFPVWAILREARWMVSDACWCCPRQVIIFKERVSSSHVLFHFQLEQNPREALCPLPAIASPLPNLSYQPSTCRTALCGRCSQLSPRQVLEEPLAHQTAPDFSFDFRGKAIHFYFSWQEPGCPLLTWPPVSLPRPWLAGLLNLMTSLTCIP